MGHLDENSLVEYDNGPWEALMVLAEKPHMENVPWHEYQLRLCMSYQKLNQVTLQFSFPIPRCNYVVQEINKGEKYFISVELDSGYWKLVAEEETQ